MSNPFLLMRWWQITPAPLAQLAMQTTAVFDLPEATGYRLVCNGVGAGFFNRTQIATDLEQRTLVHLPVVDLPRLYRDTAVVCLAPQPPALPTPTQNLLDLLRAQAKRMGVLVEESGE